MREGAVDHRVLLPCLSLTFIRILRFSRKRLIISSNTVRSLTRIDFIALSIVILSIEANKGQSTVNSSFCPWLAAPAKVLIMQLRINDVDAHNTGVSCKKKVLLPDD